MNKKACGSLDHVTYSIPFSHDVPPIMALPLRDISENPCAAKALDGPSVVARSWIEALATVAYVTTINGTVSSTGSEEDLVECHNYRYYKTRLLVTGKSCCSTRVPDNAEVDTTVRGRCQEASFNATPSIRTNDRNTATNDPHVNIFSNRPLYWVYFLFSLGLLLMMYDSTAAVAEVKDVFREKAARDDEEGKSATADASTTRNDENNLPPSNTTRIERLVDKIQTRRAKRLEVTNKVRKSFVEICKQCAATSPGPQNVIPFEDLVTLKETHESADKTDPEVNKVLRLAVRTCEEVDEDAFHFQEFCDYELSTKKSVFGRNPLLGALVGVLAYYFFSAVLFCGIMGDNSTCPHAEGDNAEGTYGGWVTAIYFASATISTVGYGDVSVVASGTETWRMVIGTLYMIVAMIVAVTIFSTLSDTVLESAGLNDSREIASPWMSRIFKPFLDRAAEQDLNSRVRTVTYIRVFELSYYFLLINVFAMLVARIIFVFMDEDDLVDWTWMTTFYWAVQTTTTIGYGDLDMPFELRWFNLFFTILGTTFAASLLGSLASLDGELKDMRKFYAWKNRQVSTKLISDMEGDDDDEIDEYEFLVGSLITLDKITREDVKEIMDKFRELAGEDQRITKEDIERHNFSIYHSESKREAAGSASSWRGNVFWSDAEVCVRPPSPDQGDEQFYECAA